MAETSMFAGEEEELRQAIEVGRMHKIAAEVWTAFLNNRREEIIRVLETGYTPTVQGLNDMITELRVMQKFRNVCNKMIQLGEVAEERMSEIASQEKI